MKGLSVLSLVCFAYAYLGDDKNNADPSDRESFDLRVFPMGSHLIISWRDLPHPNGATHVVTVNYTSGIKRAETVTNGLFIRDIDQSEIREICVGPVNYEYGQSIECLNRTQIEKHLSIRGSPENIDIQVENDDLRSQWTENNSLVKSYVGIWITGTSHNFTEVIHRGRPESVLRSYEFCALYTFFLYGILNDGVWVKMGHHVLDKEKTWIKNVAAFPRKQSVLVRWDYSKKCPLGMGRITVSSANKTFYQSQNMRKQYAILRTGLENQTYQVTIESFGISGHHTLVTFNRTFFISSDPHHFVPVVIETVDTGTYVYWLDEPTNNRPILALWFHNNDLHGVNWLELEKSSIEFHRRDPCYVYDLVLIKQLNSMTYENVASMEIKGDLLDGNEADAFRVGDELIVMWKPGRLCTLMKTVVHYITDGSTGSFYWSSKSEFMRFPNAGSLAYINITFTPYDYKIHRKFRRDNNAIHTDIDKDTIEIRQTRFFHSAIDFTWEPPASNAYALMVIWDLGESMKFQMNSPHDWHSVLYPTIPCAKHIVSVILMFTCGLRIDTGQTTLQAGKPVVTAVSVLGTHALIDWELNDLCPLMALNLRWTKEPKGRSTAVDFRSSKQILLWNLEYCHQYEFHLVASYANQTDVLSDPVLLNVSIESSRLKPSLRIFNNTLHVHWQSNNTCKLLGSVVRVVQDGRDMIERSHTPDVTDDKFSLSSKYSLYSVSVTFTYSDYYKINSEVSAVRYSKISQSSIQLMGQIIGDMMHLTWNTSSPNGILYYRIDAIYNTNQNFTLITTENELRIPVVRTADYVLVVAMAVSTATKNTQSNLLIMYPIKVPPKPNPPSWKKGDSTIIMRWQHADDNPEYVNHLIVRDLHGAIVQHIYVVQTRWEYELSETYCPTDRCSITLQVANRYGKSQESVPVWPR